MHYVKKRDSKVTTQKYALDSRLFDLLAIVAKVENRSRNSIVEESILELCSQRSLPFTFKRIVKKKFMLRPDTLELLKNTAQSLKISEAKLLSKALKEFLLKRGGV